MRGDFLCDCRSGDPQFIFYRSLPPYHIPFFKTVYLHRALFGLGIFLPEEDYPEIIPALSDLYCSPDGFLDVCPHVQIWDAL